MSFHTRLERLEQEEGDPFLIIHVTGGFFKPPPDPRAEIARAKAAGERFALVGLPDDDNSIALSLHVGR